MASFLSRAQREHANSLALKTGKDALLARAKNGRARARLPCHVVHDSCALPAAVVQLIDYTKYRNGCSDIFREWRRDIDDAVHRMASKNLVVCITGTTSTVSSGSDAASAANATSPPSAAEPSTKNGGTGTASTGGESARNPPLSSPWAPPSAAFSPRPMAAADSGKAMAAAAGAHGRHHRGGASSTRDGDSAGGDKEFVDCLVALLLVPPSAAASAAAAKADEKEEDRAATPRITASSSWLQQSAAPAAVAVTAAVPEAAPIPAVAKPVPAVVPPSFHPVHGRISPYQPSHAAAPEQGRGASSGSPLAAQLVPWRPPPPPLPPRAPDVAADVLQAQAQQQTAQQRPLLPLPVTAGARAGAPAPTATTAAAGRGLVKVTEEMRRGGHIAHVPYPHAGSGQQQHQQQAAAPRQLPTAPPPFCRFLMQQQVKDVVVIPGTAAAGALPPPLRPLPLPLPQQLLGVMAPPAPGPAARPPAVMLAAAGVVLPAGSVKIMNYGAYLQRQKQLQEQHQQRVQQAARMDIWLQARRQQYLEEQGRAALCSDGDDGVWRWLEDPRNRW